MLLDGSDRSEIAESGFNGGLQWEVLTRDFFILASST